MAVKRAAVLVFLLHLMLFHVVASESAERRVGTTVRRQPLLQEKATLLALKRSLTLLSPSVLANWNESNADVCNFTGVACDRKWRHHVTGLSLGNMDISGGIPPVIGNLTRLKSLDMSSNFLTGRIPDELSNLRRLQILHLGRNQLSGGIPPSLSELASVFYLNLKDNRLSGPIPAVIFKNCTSLSVVDFGNNNLSGEIPADASDNIANWFVALNLYSNRLIGRLPRWLANCTYLYLLDVENNSLADELPASIITGKQQLNFLHLSNNDWFWSHDGNTNLEPFFAAVSNCSQILEIEASAVGIGGWLPSRLGSMLPPNIQHLNLELNEIKGHIPADIGDVINITHLDLSSNQLNGTVPASICALQKLERLILYNNTLTGTIPACIGNATSLGELDLSGNALSGEIPATSLAECIGLLILDLSDNSLTGELR